MGDVITGDILYTAFLYRGLRFLVRHCTFVPQYGAPCDELPNVMWCSLSLLTYYGILPWVNMVGAIIYWILTR